MSKLNQALARYQSALLSTAAGDLIARKSGAVQGPAFELLAARDAVINSARNLSAERFTAALMEFRFLEPQKPEARILTQAEVEEALKPWTNELSDAARAEGWDIFECTGSDAGTVQVQMCEDSGILDTDHDAMRVVNTGTGEHHRVARQILSVWNPAEFELVRRSY